MLRITLVILTSLLAAVSPASQPTETLVAGGSKGWSGWSRSDAWAIHQMLRAGNPFPDHPHLSSGETATGVASSPAFRITGDELRIWINGWCGRTTDYASRLELVDASSGSVLRTVFPPDNDAFIMTSIPTTELHGRTVRLVMHDNDSGQGFAWLGLAAVKQITLPRSAQTRTFALVPMQAGLGIWKVEQSRFDAPFLSSLAYGEMEVGMVQSPQFRIEGDRIRLVLRGWDGRHDEINSHRVELIDAVSHKVLRNARPPLTDSPTPQEWDVRDLKGRRVYVRLADGNSYPSFAWLGIDELDARPSYHVKLNTPEATRGWSSSAGESMQRIISGVPFQCVDRSVVPDGGSYTVNIQAKASRLYLYGMTHSADRGNNVWEDPRQVQNRFWISDRLGSVRVRYADGVSETYPLVLGESLWWGLRFLNAPEPFISTPRARAALQRGLRLHPQGPSPDGRYIAMIRLRPVRVASVTLFDSNHKSGVPIILGMTLEGMKEDVPKHLTRLVSRIQLAPGLTTLRPLRQLPDRDTVITPEINALIEALYVTARQTSAPKEPTLPVGYAAPTVRFEGIPEAGILQGMFHHNVQDMLNKVDANGFYNTSTQHAPTYDGYEGFGTYLLNYGAYHGQIWTRDMGRAMIELCRLGLLDKPTRAADYVLNLARVWETGPQPGMDIKGSGRLDLDGHSLPRHIVRRLNYPDTKPGEGCFENDGHGLTTLFLHSLWRRLPDRNAWARARWDDLKALGDWIEWQFANPALSGATGDVLRTDSECSGGIGYSIYADFLCAEALYALCDIADALGETASSHAWRTRADRMRQGMWSAYLTSEPAWGQVWTLKHSGWPNQSTVLGPSIILSDRQGLLPQDDDPQWHRVNRATLTRLIDTYAKTHPVGYYGVAMGYGQGFVTQAAILQDRMSEASAMLKWAARCTYDPKLSPWIVPEGSELHTSGAFWRRTGDLGNGVQQAELVKVVRTLLGVDDNGPGLRLCPRMPHGWTHLAVTQYPAWLESERRTVTLSHALRRTERDGYLAYAFTVTADADMPSTPLRLGPWSKRPLGKATLNGQQVSSDVTQSGDSWWITLQIPAGLRAVHVEAW